MSILTLIYFSGYIFCLLSLILDDEYGHDFEVDLFDSTWKYWVLWVIFSLGSWISVAISIDDFILAWILFFKAALKRFDKIIRATYED